MNASNVENAPNIIIAAWVLHNVAMMNHGDVSDFLADLPEEPMHNMLLFDAVDSTGAHKRDTIMKYLES